jgi:hypothetical protein
VFLQDHLVQQVQVHLVKVLVEEMLQTQAVVAVEAAAVQAPLV